LAKLSQGVNGGPETFGGKLFKRETFGGKRVPKKGVPFFTPGKNVFTGGYPRKKGGFYPPPVKNVFTGGKKTFTGGFFFLKNPFKKKFFPENF